jgi:hypothetical protein
MTERDTHDEWRSENDAWPYVTPLKETGTEPSQPPAKAAGAKCIYGKRLPGSNPTF